LWYCCKRKKQGGKLIVKIIDYFFFSSKSWILCINNLKSVISFTAFLYSSSKFFIFSSRSLISSFNFSFWFWRFSISVESSDRVGFIAVSVFIGKDWFVISGDAGKLSAVIEWGIFVLPLSVLIDGIAVKFGIGTVVWKLKGNGIILAEGKLALGLDPCEGWNVVLWLALGIVEKGLVEVFRILCVDPNNDCCFVGALPNGFVVVGAVDGVSKLNVPLGGWGRDCGCCELKVVCPKGEGVGCEVEVGGYPKGFDCVEVEVGGAIKGLVVLAVPKRLVAANGLEVVWTCPNGLDGGAVVGCCPNGFCVKVWLNLGVLNLLVDGAVAPPKGLGVCPKVVLGAPASNKLVLVVPPKGLLVVGGCCCGCWLNGFSVLVGGNKSIVLDGVAVEDVKEPNVEPPFLLSL